MLKVAIPNKGQLAEPAFSMLREAGYLSAPIHETLVVSDKQNEVEFFFLRPRDIAIYVASGNLDFGITGQDMVADSKVEVQEILPLGFAKSVFTIAGSNGMDNIKNVAKKRIATSYPGLLNQWLQNQKLTAEVVQLDGAVENAVGLGVADYVADVVATGTTLKRAGLHQLGEPIMHSQAILIGRNTADSNEQRDDFIRRINSVIVARDYVLMDYDIPSYLVEQACTITPGFESPTISGLRDSNWSAIRVMVPSVEVHSIMDQLYKIGAKGILVTQIIACRL